MNEHPFKSFINLIEFDQHIYKDMQQVEEAEHLYQQLDQQVHQLQVGLERAADHIENARKAVAGTESALKVLEEAEKDKKSRLEEVGNYKEYQALKAELDKVHAQQLSAEREVTQAWKQLEDAQHFLENTQKQSEQKLRELQAEKHKRHEMLQQLQENLNQKLRERPEKEKGVPNEWLEKYAVMKSRVSDPVVPVLREGCGACFYSVSHQDMMRLGQRAMLQCKGCFRLLYLPEVMNDVIASVDSKK